jgi:uncharacterized LabA/DUF88 family protein
MRVSLFLDGANFCYMQRDRLSWWIDLRQLLEFARSKGKLVDAFYYIGVDVPPDARQHAYLDTVTRLGFALVTKQLKTIMQADGTPTQQANLDIEIVLDMFNTIDHYDMAILVSGDGDFERPLQLLRARGKRFLVMSTHGFIARELRHKVSITWMELPSDT